MERRISVSGSWLFTLLAIARAKNIKTTRSKPIRFERAEREEIGGILRLDLG
jgi:hypothetical protein